MGNRLKEAREKKPLTIGQVQTQTKIHSTVLIALEEGRAGEILTDTYVRSFLKKYAQFLGLNSQEILKEYFPPRYETAAIIPINKNILPKETDASPKVLYMTGIAVLCLIFISLTIFAGGKFISFVKKHKVAPHSTTSVALTKKKTTIKTKDQRPKTIDQKKKTVTRAKAVSKELIPKTSPLSLVMKIKEPVLIKLKKDGVLLFARILQKGSIENITAKETIELSIGKAKSVELVLNGRPVILPDKDIISDLEITRSGVRIK